MLNTIWIILIIYLCIFGINISEKINFDNLKLKKMFQKLNFDSLYLSLGTKMGVGTFIGTTSAILIGGPSTLLWVYIFTILTSSLIYLESYIGSLYKQKLENGYISGIYYYTKFGLKKNILSIVMLILFVLTYSCLFLMLQTNTIKEILRINPLILSFIIFILLILLLSNKLNQISKILNKLVPIMCIFFLVISIYSVFKNINILPFIIKDIISSAFNKKTFLIGSLIGIKRSIFLNELLIGTTSMSSGINKENPKITAQTLTLGTYFITFIISTLVSLLILIFMYYNNFITTNYNELLIKVFEFHYGKLGLFFLALMICLLSTTTIISGMYIGISNFSYLLKEKKYINIIKVLLIIFIISGIFICTDNLWILTDNIMLILIILNTIILSLLKKKIE